MVIQTITIHSVHRGVVHRIWQENFSWILDSWQFYHFFQRVFQLPIQVLTCDSAGQISVYKFLFFSYPSKCWHVTLQAKLLSTNFCFCPAKFQQVSACLSEFQARIIQTKSENGKMWSKCRQPWGCSFVNNCKRLYMKWTTWHQRYLPNSNRNGFSYPENEDFRSQKQVSRKQGRLAKRYTGFPNYYNIYITKLSEKLTILQIFDQDRLYFNHCGTLEGLAWNGNKFFFVCPLTTTARLADDNHDKYHRQGSSICFFDHGKP